MTVGPLLENCCNSCCDEGCKNTNPVNIQSTNPECLRVDTSECWVIKLEPTCPKPTYVKAWDNVTIREVTPPDDCYIDWGECWIKGWWEVNATDEKVKACDWDTTPGYLDQKLIEWDGIIITAIGCDWHTNSKLEISIDDDYFPDPPEIPIITIDDSGSQLISATVTWDDKHHIVITDKQKTTYDNMVCVGFEANQPHDVWINSGWNARVITYVSPWTIYTGNPDMATSAGIKILEDWYYRVYWQLTVQNNSDQDENSYYFNLGRGFLHLTPGKPRPWLSASDILLSTAKHWAYGRQVLLKWKDDIDITDNWEISSWSGTGQSDDWFDGPWMTYNIDCMIDLYKWDILTLWYRPQSHMPNSRWLAGTFVFVWQDDASTEYDIVFGWTMLGVQRLSPKSFQKAAPNLVYSRI